MLQLVAAIVWESYFQMAIATGHIPARWDNDPRARYDYAYMMEIYMENR